MSIERKEMGQVAYEAYAELREWRSFDGYRIPAWDQMREDLRDAWNAAADAVISAATEQGWK
jgi:hypothetical protein